MRKKKKKDAQVTPGQVSPRKQMAGMGGLSVTKKKIKKKKV